MGNLLSLRYFNNQEEEKALVKEFFNLWYNHGIKELAEKRLQTVQQTGLYFEC